MIPPEIAQNVASAAMELAIARSNLAKAKNWEEQVILQEQFDRAQENMINAGMQVNRGITREAA